jgi:hypothetical protein
MKTETRTVYITFDNQEFDSEDAATHHEEALKLANELREADLDWYDIGPDELARFLTASYVVTPRI